MSRPVPLVDDLALDAVQWIRHHAAPRMGSLPVLGLEGDLQQHLGRGSHEVELAGVLVGEGAATALGDLQAKAAAGEEVTFTADITTALELDRMVIVRAVFEEQAGQPGRLLWYLHLRESPPLPEPASLSPFGGLDGFDLGFDTDILGDIADMAGDLQDAMDMVNDALGALDALSALGDLSLDNPLGPIQEEAGALASLGQGAASAAEAISSLLGGG